MTQDPYGQPPGPGHVVAGEVVQDDEADVTPDTYPMTRFQKVASALRGDRTDPAMPIPHENDLDAPAARADAKEDTDATPTEEVAAVHSPDGGGRDYWDDTDQPRPDAAAASAASAASPAAPAATDTIPPDAAFPSPVGVTDEPVADAGTHAAVPAQEGMRPGESDRALGDFSDLLYGSLLPDAAEFKAQWQRVQFRFVDDPQGSVTDAAEVVAQLTAKLEAAIQERQRAIAERQSALRARWSEGKSTDTESLRETLLMYRTFLDQLTEPKTRQPGLP
jgi:hypothetical protein